MSTHQVQVQPSERQFCVADGQTVLAAGLDAGLMLPYGCKDGACGSCKGRVLAGRVHHGPHAAAALSPEEEAAGLALFCCAMADSDLVIEVRVPETADGIAPRRLPARIERIERPARDVAILWLTLAAGEQLAFRAGQYVDFLLAGGARRSYSIASPPGAPGPLEFHIRHMPGGVFTDALFGAAATVRERGILRIEGPLGSFHLREDAAGPIVLLASGTGFAPIKAIAETIFAKGLQRTRPVVLYWGARTRADLYRDELPRRWAREHAGFRYVPVLSEPDADAPAAQAPASAWTGRTGLVHEAVMADLPDLSAFQVYASGAPVMVHAAHRDLVAHCRLREENFFSDAFVSRADLPSASAT
jgi:CDP-4-dehydro-6-deoxyglucose reductase